MRQRRRQRDHKGSSSSGNTGTFQRVEDAMRVTPEVYAQLEALVEKGLRIGEEVGGFIVVPEGGVGIGAEFVECENVAPRSDRYGSFSYANDVWERIVDPALDRGREPVPFHTHVNFASVLSPEDVQFLPKSPKVVHGAEGFRVYVWSASSDQYEPEEL